MKKQLIQGAALLLIGFTIGYTVKTGFFRAAGDTEYSYKTGEYVNRYLKSFNRVDPLYPADNSGLVPDIAVKKAAVLESMNNSGKHASQFSWFPRIQEEHVFVYAKDLGNARFTVDIGNGGFSVEEGFDTTTKPTMTVPITADGIVNLEPLLKDGKLSYSEKYMIYNALTVPALQALYNTDPLYLPGDKSRFRYDDIVHIVIPPAEPVLFGNDPLDIQATAVNVDGQWMAFGGLQGDPDFKISMTLEQATDLYVMGIYDVRNLKTPAQATDLSARFLDFLDETVTYVRKDHR